MVDRKISKTRYILAFVLTIVIFTLGIYLGRSISEERLTYFREIDTTERLSFESIQIQYMYLSFLQQEKNCPVLSKTLEESVKILEKARIRLESYLKNQKIDQIEYQLSKRSYTLAELRYWLLSKQTKQACKRNTVSILYFYNNNCVSCESQALLLTYFKNIFNEKLLIFSIDSTLEEPMVEILKESYNITEYPSLVMEDKTFNAFVEENELLKQICSSFAQPIQECEDVI